MNHMNEIGKLCCVYGFTIKKRRKGVLGYNVWRGYNIKEGNKEWYTFN